VQFHQTHSINLKNFGLLFVLLIISATLIFTSCDQTFEPLKENNQYNFNISGYLDASADTQWVRVGTVRESIDEPPNPEGIQVTLEDLQSGASVVMNDSVFTFQNVLNYWSTMDIENEQSYRISVEGADGRSSRVSVTTPKKLPMPYVVTEGPPAGAYIIIDEAVEDIADVQSVYFVILNPGTENRKRIYRFPIRSTLRHTTAYHGGYAAYANWEEQEEQIEQSVGAAEIEIASRQFFVAAGGPEWDSDFTTIDDLTYFLDGTATNVENGLGYAVGISSAWFQQSDCLAPDGSKHIPCEPEESFW
jgi:hypothetical protein